ncbi:transglycosylase SLT domain-containing protein [Nocardioides yefusunii]|uniref:Transglycosylase SLT domain-containing protein n=1 Tax=Nocardioides yefusunii TaxID=2500546 RepID=A0ABW1QYR3_9ACTN|nr:transglycosylase SLT domain-containing protein [Nocardioides yefusunii]
MSVADVTTRISEIQSRMQELAHFSPTGTVFGGSGPVGSVGNAASAAAFSEALSTASDALGVDLSSVDALSSSGLDAAALQGLLTTSGTSTDTDATSGTTSGTAAGKAVVAEAKEYLGLPYVWGGTSKTAGVDCSGLVQSVYKKFGYDLPRVSADQARSGRAVTSLAQAQPGDLLAWDNSSRNKGADHVAIYVGDGKMIEAPRRGQDVRITTVKDAPDFIRRILPDAASGTSATRPTSTVTGASRPSTASAPYEALFTSAGAKYGVSPALLREVARQESSFNPKAVSPAGAQGLMQLMPATAKGLGVTNSFDPAQAVDGAAKLLSTLTKQFGSTKLALAAYNAGPGAVIRHDGVPPYAETQNYVRSITSKLGISQ